MSNNPLTQSVDSLKRLPLMPGSVYPNTQKRSHNKNQLFVRSSMGSMGIYNLNLL